MDIDATKIDLVIGHNARSQGAVRVTDKRTEYDINTDLPQRSGISTRRAM